MRAIVTQVRAGILRRRAQTLTVLLICALAGGVATMATTLLVRSSQPYEDARARYAGADLTFHFDAALTRSADLAATASLPGVLAATPPQPAVMAPFRDGNTKGNLYLIGRDDPGGNIDRIPIVAGRWPQRSGEVAIFGTRDTSVPFRPRLGDTLDALTERGVQHLKVVGLVVDLGGHAPPELDYYNVPTAAWVRAADVAPYADALHPLSLEVQYRFQHASTAEELAADRRLIESHLPAAEQPVSVVDWLHTRDGYLWLIQLMSAIVLAFTVFALLAVTLIVAGVVAGAVLANYRDIGIAKALGFTPREVVLVYVCQMVVLAVVGALIGVPFGSLASRAFLDDAAQSTQLPAPPFFDPVVAMSVPLAIGALVALAALLPALRAAATDSIRAMTMGSAPATGRRSRLAALLGRLGVPRALSLGAGDAFARPARAGLALAALVSAVATATFGVGFNAVLTNLLVNERAAYGYGQDVIVDRYGGIPDADLAAGLAQQPDTRLVIAVRRAEVHLSGRKEPDMVYAMRGDAQGLGWRAAKGRWFSAPGEAVVSAGILNETHRRIGDTITGTLVGGTRLSLRVVGVVNDFSTSGRSIRTGFESLAAAVPGVEPSQYLVKLRAGSDAAAFAKRVTALSPGYLDAHQTLLSDLNLYVNGLTGMVGGLALVLMLISGAGVFNATLLTVRERVRDIAILKAVGMTGFQVAQLAFGSTAVLTIVGTVLGIPAGLWLEGIIWSSMGQTLGVVIDAGVSVAPLSVLLAVAGAFLLALAGAALPARWAAATPVALVLRSE